MSTLCPKPRNEPPCWRRRNRRAQRGQRKKVKRRECAGVVRNVKPCAFRIALTRTAGPLATLRHLHNGKESLSVSRNVDLRSDVRGGVGNALGEIIDVVVLTHVFGECSDLA